MIRALENFVELNGYKGKFYLINNYKNDDNFPKYSKFYSSLWYRNGKEKILLYDSKKAGVLKEKDDIYQELSNHILLSFLIDIKSGELWKKIKL